jgi:trimeric autotransporter adhesin
VPGTGTNLGHAGTFAWADSQQVDLVSTDSNQFLVRAAGGVWLGTTSSVSIPSGRFINTSTGAYLSSGGTWTNASSRHLKTGFQPVDPASVLERLLRLPLFDWRYADSPDEGRHLGPVAEDFHALFGLGNSPEAISTVDADGVALAAIQGLNAKLEGLIAEQSQALGALRDENAALQARLASLEQTISGRGLHQAP